MPESADLTRFYEEAYSRAPAEAELYSRWRALGAVGKADHVTSLCRRARIASARTLDVGCGDGALLSELHRRGFGGHLRGVEISDAAVAIAREREGIEGVDLYDGRTLPFERAAFDLGVLSHVLEHVPDPPALLAEVARVCRAVVVEVPLEANWSAQRGHKRVHAEEVGHLQRLDRAAARAIVSDAGLSIAGELEDPLPLRVHTFFARSGAARMRARVKWALRGVVHVAAPPLARRAFTLHWACLCLPPDASPLRAGARSRGP
jgi:SAM-dependent methyltransferase